MNLELSSTGVRLTVDLHANDADDSAAVCARHLVLTGDIDSVSARLIADMVVADTDAARVTQLELSVAGVRTISAQDAGLILDTGLVCCRTWFGELVITDAVGAPALAFAAAARGIRTREIGRCRCASRRLVLGS